MILSASRRTDIPAFFSKWFYQRIKEGFVYVRNPMNYHQVSNIKLSPETIECIVFWTKNPSDDFIDNLKLLDDMGYRYYFQFTLTSYNKNIEVDVPRKCAVMAQFKKLSDKIGKEKVIWRYDPIFINETYTLEYHKKYFTYLVDELSPYTEKCIFSFIDFYPKIQKRLLSQNIRRLDLNEMDDIARLIAEVTEADGIKAESCCESINLEKYGIGHGYCIDGELINRLTNGSYDFKKDKNQRNECGCASSVDIGAYGTCRHNCIYCYADSNRAVKLNGSEYCSGSCMDYSPLLGEMPGKDDVVSERILKPCPVIEKDLFTF